MPEIWGVRLTDDDARYDVTDEIDRSALEPLIALPSSPGNVKPVREVAGTEITQALIGSSANPGLRDFMIAARIVPAGPGLNKAGCLGCIGVGQAPASGAVSLRTVPRNFPGRSGTRDDQVYLCSPETAAASALTGRITDPRDLDIAYERLEPPREQAINTRMLVAPDAQSD